MYDFSPIQRGEIEQFASLLGVDARPSADASYNFEFDRLGTLSIQPAAHERVVVSLARVVPFPSPALAEKCLASAGADSIDGLLVHAGLSGDGAYVLALDLPASGVSANDFDGALGRLARMFEDLA